MKSVTLLAVLSLLAFQTVISCPPQAELVENVKHCLQKMMLFVNAKGNEGRKARCPDLKEGVDCVDEMLEACKDSDVLMGQYDMLKERLEKSREDFDYHCGSSAIPSINMSLVLLTLATALLGRTFY